MFSIIINGFTIITRFHITYYIGFSRWTTCIFVWYLVAGCYTKEGCFLVLVTTST